MSQDSRPVAIRNEGIWNWRGAAAVFAVAFVLRLIWVLCADFTPVSDFAHYRTLAYRFLEFGEPTYRRPGAWRTPAYPLFLAFFFKYFGASLKPILVAQAVLGSVSAGLVTAFASRLFTVRVGLIAGLLFAAAPTVLAYTTVLASETLATACVVAGFTALVAGGYAPRNRHVLIWIAVSGIFAGIGLLTRPALVFMVPAWVLLAAYQPMRARFRIVAPGLFVVVLCITIMPWLVRNYKAGLGFPTFATAGGVNLYMANSPTAQTGRYNAAARVPEYDKLPEQDRSRAYQRAAIQWIFENPGRYLSLTGVRLRTLLGPSVDLWAARYLWPSKEADRLLVAYENRRRDSAKNDPAAIQSGAELLLRHRRLLEKFQLALLITTIAGTIIAVRRWRSGLVVLIPILFYALGIGLTFSAQRFRQPMLPFLLILAALAIDFLFVVMWKRRVAVADSASS